MALVRYIREQFRDLEDKGYKFRDSLIENMRIFHPSLSYKIMRVFYENSSQMWLSLGLRPDLNFHITKNEQPLKVVARLPPELVNHIADFIPRENFEDQCTFKPEDFTFNYPGDFGIETYNWLNGNPGVALPTADMVFGGRHTWIEIVSRVRLPHGNYIPDGVEDDDLPDLESDADFDYIPVLEYEDFEYVPDRNIRTVQFRNLFEDPEPAPPARTGRIRSNLMASRTATPNRSVINIGRRATNDDRMRDMSPLRNNPRNNLQNPHNSRRHGRHFSNQIPFHAPRHHRYHGRRM